MANDAVIVGAGPVGLMLACELSLAGAHPVVLESLPEPSTEPKANGLVGQVVRVLDNRGLYEPLSGRPGPPRPNSTYFMFGGLALDLSLLDDSPVHTLPVPQRRMVQVLEQRATDLGVPIRRGHEVVGLSQDRDAVTVEFVGPDGPGTLRARYLVGADGGHSVTRKLAGIGFPGVSYDRTTSRVAHATVPEDWVDAETGALHVPGYGPIRPFLPHRTENGGFGYAPLPGHPPLIMTSEWDQPEPDAPMSLDDLRASARRVLGVDVPFGEPDGAGPHQLRRRVGGNTRVAERFRNGRVLLVGDAAHVFTGGGGPGLNVGLQDAVNLGWKLAAHIRGDAPSGLLDSYQTERRPVAQRAVVYGQAQVALTAPGSDVTALRELFTELLGDRGAVQRLADLVAGTDIRYDLAEPGAHPLVGRFVPDLDLDAADGPVRLAELARTARPLLLDLTPDAVLSGWWGRADVVARPRGGTRPATVLLVRPDGYVAWATSSAAPDAAELAALDAAEHCWFGVPAAQGATECV